MHDLNDLLRFHDRKGYVVISANDINSRGDIAAGAVRLSDGASIAVILKRIDD